MPIGMPGWPLLAASTASMASARMALAARDISIVMTVPDCPETTQPGPATGSEGELEGNAVARLKPKPRAHVNPLRRRNGSGSTIARWRHLDQG
jgi:hypothetical protein